MLQKQAGHLLRYWSGHYHHSFRTFSPFFNQFIYQLGEFEVWRGTPRIDMTDTNTHLQSIKLTYGKEIYIIYGSSAQPGHIVSRRLMLLIWEYDMHFTWFPISHGKLCEMSFLPCYDKILPLIIRINTGVNHGRWKSLAPVHIIGNPA